jgi:TolB-like protein/DNA-binding winged helix-turn-helix (wHTH) protein/Tfp pilus assembly protein PilF
MKDPALTYHFGRFTVETGDRRLISEGHEIYLRPKTYDTLLYLLEHQGHLVTKNELLDALWADVEVTENALTRCIKETRAALGDEVQSPRFVRTIPRLGYEFIADVEKLDEPENGEVEEEFQAVRLVTTEEESEGRLSEPVIAESSAGAPARRALLPQRVPSKRRVLVGSLAATAVVAMAVSAALNFAGLRDRLLGRTTSSRIASLAVLPFENLTGSDKQDYLSDGLTEEIITELARLDPSRLGVIARTSVMKFKAARPDVAEVGRKLSVNYILEGAVRSGPQRLGITVQLVRVSDQTHLWAQEYDLNPDDPLSWERSVAERTANALSIELLPAVQQRHTAMREIKPEAREAYLRGRFLLANRNAPTFHQALAYFNKAVEYEPEYAEAYSGIADAYLLQSAYGMLPRNEAVPKAKAAALRALQLEDSLTAARRTLADIRWEYELDFEGAGKDFRSAIEANANDAGTHQWYAAYLSAKGEFNEAIREMKKAAQFDPLSLHVGVDLGRAYYFARQYDLAIAQFRKTLELDPNFARAHSQLGMALLEKGQYDEALTELRTGAGHSGVSIWLGYAYAKAGKIAAAKEQLARQLDQWQRAHTGADGIALTYLGLGDKDQAFAWLEKDLENHGAVHMIKAWPYWDPLHSDSRYQDLLRRIGIPS